MECVKEWGRNLMEERKSKLTMKKQKKGRGRKKDLDLSGDMLVC